VSPFRTLSLGLVTFRPAAVVAVAAVVVPGDVVTVGAAAVDVLVLPAVVPMVALTRAEVVVAKEVAEEEPAVVVESPDVSESLPHPMVVSSTAPQAALAILRRFMTGT
jgi:hypothetical protein